MPRITRRHLVIGGGILIAGLLIWQIAYPKGGEEDPPPIIVSSGGSILLALPVGGVFNQAWLGGPWYNAQDTATQHAPEWLEVKVVGAVDSNDPNVPCGSYPSVRRLFIDYGSGNPQTTIDASIGWVFAVTLGKHLKFSPTPANGSQEANRNEVRFAKGEAVFLSTVTIHPGTGSPMTCRFTVQSTDPAVASIWIQQRHTP